MFDGFKANSLQLVPFSEDELLLFMSMFTSRKVPKNGYFLQEGGQNHYVAFVNSGLLKMYSIVNGGETIVSFFSANCWMADYPSFLSRKPAEMNIKALMDSELLILSHDSIQKLYKRSANFERFGRLLAEGLFMQLMEHITELMRDKPETRYLRLMERQPELFEMVSLSQIAAYLGVKPESLSRIRKRLSTSNV